MTHDITLDEAIEHAKQVARTCDDDQCAAEHIQLAEWLRTARGAEAAGRWYTAKVRELEAENAKLREERNHWHVEQVHAYSNWEVAYRRVSELESENAKLRELVSSVLVLRHDSTYKWLDIGLAEICGKGFTEQARELGIEVDA